MDFRKYFAEFVGVFALTLAVYLSTVIELPLSTPLMAGITLGLFVYTIGPISGAHLNPAVSVALATVKKISWKDTVFYVVFQFAGAVLAMLLAQGVSGQVTAVASTGGVSIFGEALGAFFLLFGVASVVFGKVDDDASGLVIGSSLFLGASLAGFSLGVLNPAVAAALGLFDVAYLVGPVVGALIAVWGYKVLAKG